MRSRELEGAVEELNRVLVLLEGNGVVTQEGSGVNE